MFAFGNDMYFYYRLSFTIIALGPLVRGMGKLPLTNEI